MKTESLLDYGISISRVFFKYYYYIYILLLVLVLVTLSVVGGLVFQIVESPPEAKIIDAIMRQRDSTIRQLRVKIQAGENKGEVTLFIQLYEGQYIGAIRNGTVILDGKQDPLWTFEGSVYYCVTTFSLVGYGNLAPRTNLGRAIAIIYCGFTIPVSSLIVAELGEMLLLAFEYVWKTFYSLKPKEEKTPPTGPETTNMNNANTNTCNNYQVTIRCSRDTPDTISHDSGTNVLRYFSASSDGCTAQDTRNLIRRGPLQRAPDLILGASSGNDPEDALGSCHGNTPENIVTGFEMNNIVCAMENSPMTATQDAWSDSTGNNPDVMFADFEMNYLTCDFENSPMTASQGALSGCAMDGCVETSDSMHRHVSMDVCDDYLHDFAAVDSSGVSGGSCMHDPVYGVLGFHKNYKCCLSDGYHGDDLKDCLGDTTITESETANYGSWMITPRVAHHESSSSALDIALGGYSAKDASDILCDCTLRESEETNDDSVIHCFDAAVCESTIDAPVNDMGDSTIDAHIHDLGDSTIDAAINDMGESTTNAPANYLGDSTNDAHKDDLSHSHNDAREENAANSTTDSHEVDLRDSTFEASVDVLRDYIFEASVDILRDYIFEASVDILRDYIFEASVDILRDYIFESFVDILGDYMFEASVDDLCDSTTDADVGHLDKVSVDKEDTFLDRHSIIINIPLHCVPRFHMQDLTQGQLKRDHRLNISACHNFSTPTLRIVAETFVSRDQERIMSISCRCSEINPHFAVTYRTPSGREDFSTSDSDLPSSGDICVKSSTDTREPDNTRHGRVTDSTRHGRVTESTRHGRVTDSTRHGRVTGSTRHGRVTGSTRHGRVTGSTRHGRVTDSTRHGRVTDNTRHGSQADMTRHGSVFGRERAGRKQAGRLIRALEWTRDKELGRVPASSAVTTLWSTLMLKLQARDPVCHMSLSGRCTLSDIHHMEPASRMILVEVKAAGANDRNNPSGKCRVGIQPYSVDKLLGQIRLSSATERSHGDTAGPLAPVKLSCLTEHDSMHVKTVIIPSRSCNMPGQMTAQTKRGTFLPHYRLRIMPRIDTIDQDKLLTSVAQHSLGHQHIYWVQSGMFDCGRSHILSPVCPIILVPKRNTTNRATFRASYSQNRILAFPSNTPLEVLPRRSKTQNAMFETMDICRRCFIHANLDCVRKISPSRPQSRGFHPRLAETSVGTESSGECENTPRTTVLLAKDVQSSHLQWRCYTNKLVSCNKLPRKASRTRTKIRQEMDTDRSKARSEPGPGVFSRVKAVAKLVLTRKVTMPDSVSMFWLGTPFRCLYIGRRVGHAIHRHFRDAQVQNCSPDGSSVTESLGQASNCNHTTPDKNNNVHSEDDDDDDEDDDDNEDDDDDNDEYRDPGESQTTELQSLESKIASEPVLLTIATTFIFISLGSTFLTKFAENMTYFDSYWFIWISVATIGYGDIVPTEQKLFLGILAYLFIGLCLMSNLISETSLFFSANVAKTRAITSDAVAIINTRKQLILIQKRAEKANKHWAILRERVLNKKIPRHLVEESIKYKAGLMAEEREMVRWAYKLYFKQDHKPVSIFDTANDNFEPALELFAHADEEDLSEFMPIEEPEPVYKPTVKRKEKTGLLQTIKRVAVNSYRRVKNKVKRRSTEGSSTQIMDPKLDLETGQGLTPASTSMPPTDTQVAPSGEPAQS